MTNDGIASLHHFCDSFFIKTKLVAKIYLCVLVSGGENVLPQNVVKSPLEDLKKQGT
jgi:hypothetical protein